MLKRVLALPKFICLILFIGFGCKKESEIIPNNKSTTDSTTTVDISVSSSGFVNVQSFGAEGNGSDDTKALQQALNSGKPLFFPKGTYVISTSLKKSGGSLIINANPDAIIKLAPSFPNGVDTATGAFILNNLDSLNINGLTIDGNRGTLINTGSDWRNYIMGVQLEKSANITISNCSIVNGPSVAFSIGNSSNIEVKNCNVTNTIYHGICFNNCTNARAENNQIIGIGNQGTNVAIGGIGILGTGGSYITILHNYVDYSSDTGIKTEGCNNVVFDSNTVSNSGKDGIKFENRHGQGIGQPDIDIVYHAKIINNTVSKIYNGRDDGSCLIQSYAGQDVLIANNTIIGGDKTGVEDGIQIDQNNDFTAKYSKDIIITGNTIRNTNRFIYINSSVNVTVTNNICENIAAPSNQYNGVELLESNSLMIKNNSFKRNGISSIDGYAVNIVNCREMSFINNKVTNGNKGIAATFSSSKRIDISNNIFDNFGSYFASITGTSNQSIDSLLITNNTVSHFGMNGAIGWIFKIDIKNSTCGLLDLTGTKILGNGLNGDFGLTISGGENITTTNLTDFSCNGNAVYPTASALDGCNNIIGWKSKN